MYDNGDKKCLKFSIQKKLNQLPKLESELADRTLYKALGISRSTWFKYKSAQCGDKYDLPLIHAIQLARFFNCKVDELLNIDVKPLTEPDLKQFDKK